MNDSVAVIIPVFGDFEYWNPLAERAMRSVKAQTRQPDIAMIYRGDDLMTARNHPSVICGQDWLCFLDADDEMERDYLADALSLESGDIRYPRVSVVDSTGYCRPPFSYGKTDLLQQNYIVVSALVRNELFKRVGGFRDLPFYEDWDLWIRCWRAGAVIVESPGSILYVHYRPNSRNCVPYEQAARFGTEMRDLYQ